MKLSILIPSNRPEGLTEFLDSLAENTHQRNDIEIVILVDEFEQPNYVEYNNYRGFRTVIIHQPPIKPVNISQMQNECFRLSQGEWIMLGNDDVICRTKDWDVAVRQAMEVFDDQLCLIYPNDGMFGEKLACFPIISKKFIDLVSLFPMPYRRYKVDDTIFHLIPHNRKIYLSNVLFSHLNSDLNPTTEGFRLPSGQVYPINREAASFDNILWDSESSRRVAMEDKLFHALALRRAKVMVGVVTDEYARRADFYDYYNILHKPVNTIAFFCHARSPAKGRNTIINTAMKQECTHILFVDDDMAYQPDSLIKLLSHDKEIVSGLYLNRAYPHQPFAFDVAAEDGSVRPMFLNSQNGNNLVPIVAAGFGFLLVKTTLFPRMKKPYVRLGELDAEEWCDDIGFFKRVREEAKAQSYVDLSVCCGHMGTMIVWPNKDAAGKWNTGYDTNGVGAINVPQLEEPK